ncbi:MAG: V-type ATP synthase subunit E [Symbiobacteriaceae bacterium]|nr:V-type ATP synthase subunit E [Symbiobacteriaceae bacterium]
MALTDRLSQQIITDAKNEAEAIRQAAEETAARLLREAEDKALLDAEAAQKDAALQAVDARRRIQIAAELTVRRETLASKQRLLSQVYASALQQLHKLPDKEWSDLIQKLVLDHVETGREKVRFTAADLERGKKVVSRLNQALKARGQTASLTWDDFPGDFEGGVVLVGEKTEKNASFEVLLRTLRDQSETEVAALLF